MVSNIEQLKKIAKVYNINLTYEVSAPGVPKGSRLRKKASHLLRDIYREAKRCKSVLARPEPKSWQTASMSNKNVRNQKIKRTTCGHFLRQTKNLRNKYNKNPKYKRGI